MAVSALPRSREYLALCSAEEKIVEGWTQGAYWRSPTGRADCLPENSRRVDLCYALEIAAAEYGLDPEELRDLVRAELDEPYSSDAAYGLERWNDTAYREKRDVILLLERTIGRLS